MKTIYFISGIILILAIKDTGNNIIEKLKYSLSGVVISHVIDNISNNLILIKSGEKEVYLKDNSVIKTKQNIKLKAIIKPSSNVLFVHNPNIGVIDIETYLAKDNIQKVHAIGFKTNLDKNPVTYYISKQDLDHNKIILSLINELIRPKYDKITFYCHNLSGYDIVFILKVLFAYNDSNCNTDEDKFKVSCVLRDDRIIKITIGKNKHSFTIHDSYCILPNSLRLLADNFDVDTVKSIFPYRFATQDHLFYIGNTPDIHFYQDVSTEKW